MQGAGSDGWRFFAVLAKDKPGSRHSNDRISMRIFMSYGLPFRCYRGIPAALLAVGLGACATDGAGTPGGAGSGPGAGTPRSIGVVTTVQPVPEFVSASRPATAPEFIPVGVTPPARATDRRSAEDVKKLEADLDSQRSRSRAFAGRPAPKSSYDGKLPPRPTRPPKEPAAE